MKFWTLFVLVTAAVSMLQAKTLRWESPQELIAFETMQIVRTQPENYYVLTERYLDRAETYLLCNEWDAALSDLHIGYQLASEYLDEESNKGLLFQALFGTAIIYGAQDKMDLFYATMTSIDRLLMSCVCLSENDNANPLSVHLVSNSMAYPPICGPDRIPIDTCIEFVEGTVEKCRYLIQCVPKPEIRVMLNITIDGLRKQAIGCCKAGGIWKACLQPLTNKWYLWNQKWQLFAIPPDPAWD